MQLKDGAGQCFLSLLLILSGHLGMILKTLISFWTMGNCYFKTIFARFTTMQGKKILASVVEIQKENWG